jgi:hypothetical protein
VKSPEMGRGMVPGCVTGTLTPVVAMDMTLLPRARRG